VRRSAISGVALAAVLAVVLAGPATASVSRVHVRVAGLDGGKLLIAVRCPAHAARRACIGHLIARSGLHGFVVAKGRFSVRPRRVRLLSLPLTGRGRRYARASAVLQKRLIVLDVKLASGLTVDFTQVVPVFSKSAIAGAITNCPGSALVGSTSKLTASFNVLDILTAFGLTPAEAIAGGVQTNSPPYPGRFMYFGPSTAFGRALAYSPPVIKSYTYQFNDAVTWTEPGRWEVVVNWQAFNFPNLAITPPCAVDVKPPQPKAPPPPPPKAPPPPTSTSLTLICPTGVPQSNHGQATVSGRLSPAVAGARVTITYASGTSIDSPPTVTDTVMTDSGGNYTDTAALSEGYQYTSQASWSGDAAHTPTVSSICGPFYVL
jgi:hypothetical protein